MGAGHSPSQERPLRAKALGRAFRHSKEICGWKEGDMAVVQWRGGLPHGLLEEEPGETPDPGVVGESQPILSTRKKTKTRDNE